MREQSRGLCLRRLTSTRPVFRTERLPQGGMTHRLKLVVAVADRLHLFILRFAVERRVSAQKEVSDDSDSPDIDGFAMACFLEDLGLSSVHCTDRASGP